MACTKFADTSSSYLAYGVQTDCGVPQNTLKNLRFTSNELQFSAESTQSEEINDHGNVTDLIRTSSSVGGSIGFELSYEEFDPFLEAALRSAVALDGADTPIWNGKSQKYFTFEDKVTGDDGAGGDQDYFRQFTDCEVNTLSLSITQGEVITGTMGIIGRGHTTSTTSVDPSIDPSHSNPVYNTVSMISSVQVDTGSGFADIGQVNSITMDINTNKREQRALGSEFAAGIGEGQFVVTGTMEIYFSDATLYDIFLQDGDLAFRMTVDDNTGIVNGNQYTLVMPKVKFGNVTRTIPTNNQDVVLTAEYQAIYDATNGSISLASLDSSDV